MASVEDKPAAAHVQHAPVHETHHHRTLSVVSIEQEAHQDVHHVNLSWRSWVCSEKLDLLPCSPVLDRCIRYLLRYHGPSFRGCGGWVCHRLHRSGFR